MELVHFDNDNHEKIPSLEELFRFCSNNDCIFNIDLKK